MAYDLTSWDPFRDLSSLQEDMNRLFGDFIGRRGRGLRSRSGAGSEILWAPALDIEETPDEVIVKAELPGMKKEEIKVQIQGGMLALSGERKSESERKDKTVHLVEQSYGRFQRVVELPAEVDGNRAKATYESGVLTIRLPKREDAKPKQISVDVR